MHSFADPASERRGGRVDERVAMAISHWAPRFTMNGVTAGDFERITGGLTSWNDWCSAWSAVAAEHELLGRDALAEGREMSAGAHLSQAAVYYHFAKFLFVNDLDQMREAHGKAVRCLNDALPYLDPPGKRVEIPFEGSAIVGVLREPRGRGPHPVMIMIPGLDSTKEELRSTEELFLERDIATFSVDGPGQGEAEYDLAMWRLGGPRRRDHRLRDHRAVARPEPDRGLGSEPRRLLRPAGGQRGRAGTGLHRAGRAVRVRRELGQPADPVQGGVPGPVQVAGPGGGAGQGGRTHPGRARRADPVPAARGDGQARPARPLAAGRAAGERGRRPRRPAPARAGQPRLRQPGAVPPLPDRGLGGRATRHAGHPGGRPVMTGGVRTASAAGAAAKRRRGRGRASSGAGATLVEIPAIAAEAHAVNAVLGG